MNADGKIYIIVTDRLPAGSETPTYESSGQSQKSAAEGLLSHWARGRLIGTVKQIASSAVNYSLSNIGNFTGNYALQVDVNNALSAIEGLFSIGTAATAGAIAGGPIGAAIAAGLEVIKQGVQWGLETNTNYVNNRKTNYQIEQLRARSGLNSLMDGSRGTEN